MPIIKSAQKRVRQEKVRKQRNLIVKRDLKTKTKAFEAAIEGGQSAKITEALKELYSALDTAAKKNIIHKNKAARKKSSASAAAKGKVTAGKAKTTAKKAPAKKPAAKKTSAKKTTKK